MKALILIGLLWLSFGDGLVAPANASTLSQFSSSRPFMLVAPCAMSINGYTVFNLSSMGMAETAMLVSQAIGAPLTPFNSTFFYCWGNGNRISINFNAENKANLASQAQTNCHSQTWLLCVYKNNQY